MEDQAQYGRVEADPNPPRPNVAELRFRLILDITMTLVNNVGCSANPDIARQVERIPALAKKLADETIKNLFPPTE